MLCKRYAARRRHAFCSLRFRPTRLRLLASPQRPTPICYRRIERAVGAIEGSATLTGLAGLLAFALVTALPAIGLVGVGVHAGAVALRIAFVAFRGAPAVGAHSRGVRLGWASERAGAAICRVGRGIDAGAVAFDGGRQARKIAHACHTGRRRVGRRHANLGAGTAVSGARLQIDARAVAVLGASSANRAAFAPSADLGAATGRRASAAVRRVGAEVDALTVAIRVTEVASDVAAARTANGAAI